MQRISVTARLNRSTLQFEEAAYARLESYLAEAARTLDGNPDQQEILGDLEQAVADQCTRRTRPDQASVTLAELEPALEEIGSVQVPGASTASDQTVRVAARPLQQVSEGAVVSGVCQGLAELRPEVDAFFDKVIVNDPAPELRRNRLKLLARLRATMDAVADFSKIEA